MRNILVTGGNGFIGRGIVRSLVSKKYNVRVLDNDSRGSKSKLNDLYSSIDFRMGDIRNLDFVESACEGIDTVVHLAYINGTEFFYTKPYDILEVGIKGLLNVLDSQKKTGFKELILASSSETYQNPITFPTGEDIALVVPDVNNPRYSYGGGKIASELLALNYARQNNIAVKIFRPHNIYGPDMGNEHVVPQFISRLKVMKNQEHIFKIQGSGNETRSFCYIDDFIAAFELLLNKSTPNEIFNIGTTDEVSIAQLAQTISRLMGKQIELSQGYLTAGSPLRRCPDISKIQRMGFSQRFSLEDGLKRTIDWYSNH